MRSSRDDTAISRRRCCLALKTVWSLYAYSIHGYRIQNGSGSNSRPVGPTRARICLWFGSVTMPRDTPRNNPGNSLKNSSWSDLRTAAIHDKSDCRKGPGKFQIRSAGRLERIGKIIFAIVRHIFRIFPHDGPQSWMRSNRNNSSLFIVKENISLYLGNFIPPLSVSLRRSPNRKQIWGWLWLNAPRYCSMGTVFLHSWAPFVAAIQSTTQPKWPLFLVSNRTIAAHDLR